MPRTLLILAALAAPLSAGEVQWQSLDKAFAAARKSGKPVLALFWAEW